VGDVDGGSVQADGRAAGETFEGDQVA
jgi:hypothetical protein